MKKLTSLIAAVVILAAGAAWAAKTMPPFSLKCVDGKKMTFENYASQYELMAFVFWAMDCGPCKEELVEINKFADKYDGFGVVAVSTDTARTSSQVKPFVKGQGFKFDVVLDVDGELVKTLGVPGNPYAMLVKSDGEVFWEHSGYRKGDEVKMEEEVKKFFAAATPPPEGDATEDGE
jgi:cytochrome c biogenesis protein CcmG/thiol:disulfide interchange protein DsbE